MTSRKLFAALSTFIIGASAAGAATAAEKAAWPQPIIDRPLTLPEGALSVGTGVGGSTSSDFKDATLSVGGLWGASYGVTNELSLGVSYEMNLQGTDAGAGTFALGGGYTYYAEGALILTGTANVSYDTVANEAGALSLGTLLWFNAMPWLAIISPADQLSIGLTDPNPVGVAVPIGVGFQAIPSLFIQVDTTIAEFTLTQEGSSSFIGADATPLGLTAYFSPNNEWDISVGGGIDATPAEGLAVADTATLGAGVIYYGNVD